MTDYLRVKILLCRSEAQMLFNVLPSCDEREHLRERIAACNFVLEYLNHQEHKADERATRVRKFEWGNSRKAESPAVEQKKSVERMLRRSLP